MGAACSGAKRAEAAGDGSGLTAVAKTFSKEALDAEVESILKRSKVDYALDGSFPEAVELEAREFEGWVPTDADVAARKDLRESRRVFTIDPATAKDLDDAVHVHDLGDGTFEMGVHIADVSHFVPPGSAMDAEARHRATTVYLVDRSVPMLPRTLSEGVCSLAPGVDRLAFSVTWRMTADGRKVDGDTPWFGRTIIRSCVQLDYGTAQALIDGEAVLQAKYRPTGGHTVQQLADDLRAMHGVTLARRRWRFEEGGALRMLRKTKFHFELERGTGRPTSMSLSKLQDSNRVVEEMMLMANELVAWHLSERRPENALLRAHRSPRRKDLQKFAKYAKKHGFDVNPETSGTLHHSLDAYRQSYTAPGVNVRQLLEAMFSKSMRGAVYLCTGKSITKPHWWHHYALSMERYTHFTSPIRRYPDVVVHRQLEWLLLPEGDRPAPLTADEVDEICRHCNWRRDQAKQAQSQADRVWLTMMLEETSVCDLAAITNISSSDQPPRAEPAGASSDDESKASGDAKVGAAQGNSQHHSSSNNNNNHGPVYIGVLVPRLGLRRSIKTSAWSGAKRVDVDVESQTITVEWAESGAIQTLGLFDALHVCLEVSGLNVNLRVVETGEQSRFQ